MSIASRLKQARTARGYTQEKLGKEIGMSRGVILNIEYETAEPQKLVLHAISKILRINEEWLLTGEGQMELEAKSEYLLSEIHDLAQQLSPDEQDYILDMIQTFHKYRERLNGNNSPQTTED